MDDILLKTYDFGIRVVELSNYLEYEKKRFALINRLLECGKGIGVCMRISMSLPQCRQENYKKAFKLTLEAEYLFELMVKTSVITEHQSKPILSDCRFIKDQIGNLISNESDNNLNSKNNKEG
jgi:hypothetical protein